MKSKGGIRFLLLFIVTLLLPTVVPVELPVAGEHPWLNGARPAKSPVSPWERHYIEGFAWPPSLQTGDDIWSGGLSRSHAQGPNLAWQGKLPTARNGTRSIRIAEFLRLFAKSLDIQMLLQ